MMYENQVAKIKNSIDILPKTAVVLGSGLGGLADKIENPVIIRYSDIDGMPVSTAPLHKGQFVFGTIGGKDVVLMQGRTHLYEGYTPQQIIMPIRILKGIGVENIILTNAAGGICRDFNIGDFMMIKDHISCFVDSPLISKNDDSIGVRFPDMSNAYDKDIQKVIINAALENNIPLKSGVYVQLKGPQFETPAEISMLGKLGADAVGMSTVIETIGAVHCNMKVGAVSMISNMACGILDKPITSEEVNESAIKSADKFEKLITGIIKAL